MQKPVHKRDTTAPGRHTRSTARGGDGRIDEYRDVYAPGRGRVVVRATVAAEGVRSGRMDSVVTELP